MKRLLLPLLIALPIFLTAEVKVTPVSYAIGKDKAVGEGLLALDPAKSGKRPAVLVVHAWMGIDDHVNEVMRRLAGDGYVAFAADIYGKGVRPTDPKEAGAQAGKYKANRALLRERVNAGLAQLKANPNVDPKKIVAIGYCFGGTTVLELARSGAELAGVVSFHGGLDSPAPDDGKNIKAKVLVLHGADDPAVKAEDLSAFQKEMRDAKVDWQMVSYGGAVHAFTQKSANRPGMALYDASADRRSWAHFKGFLAELFAP